VTREQVAVWVAESRAAQGLPPTITDPAVLAAVAELTASTLAELVEAPTHREGADDAA
jgi:hypothetical protein